MSTYFTSTPTIAYSTESSADEAKTFGNKDWKKTWIMLKRLLLKTLAKSAPAIEASAGAKVTRRKAAIAVILQSVFLLNFVSLLSASERSWLSDSLSYTRFDVLSQLLGVSIVFEAIVACLSALPLLSILSFLLLPRNKALFAYRVLIALPGYLLSEVFLIPASACLLSSVLSSSSAPGDQLKSLTFAGVYGLMCVTVIGYRCLLLNPTWGTQDVYSRIGADTVVKEFIVTQSLVFSFVWGPTATQWVLTGARILAGLSTAWVFLAYSPYYNPWVNLLLAMKWLLLSWILLISRLQAALSFPGFTVLLLVVLTPVLLAWLLQNRLELTRWVQSYHRDSDFMPILRLGIELRDLLGRQPLDHSRVTDLFQRGKLMRGARVEVWVWESLYFLIHRSAADVALLRLSSFSPVSVSFPLELVLFRLKTALCKGRHAKEYEYLSYHQDCEEAAKRDADACIAFQRFLTVYMRSENAGEVFTRGEELVARVKQAKKCYQGLLGTYSNNGKVERMFGSFLVEVKCDTRGFALLNRRAKPLDTDPGSTNNYLFSLEDSLPQMIISASAARCGTIEIMNDCCCALLGLQKDAAGIEKKQLSSFIPACFTEKQHNSMLNQFGLTSETLSFTHNDVFVVISGLIGVRVAARSQLVSTGTNIYYDVTFINKTPKGDEFALISNETGRVIVRSEGFWAKLGVDWDGIDLDNAAAIVKSVVDGLKRKGEVARLRDEGYSWAGFAGRVLTYSSPAGLSASPLQQKPRADSIVKKTKFESDSQRSQSMSSLKVPHRPSTFPLFAQRTRVSYRIHTKRLWLYQLATTLLITVLLYTLLTFYFQVFSALDSVSTINDMGRRRFRTANIVDCVRELQLISVGFLPKSKEDPVRTSLSQHITDLKAIIESLRNQSDNWPAGTHRDIYFTPVVPIWEMMDRQIIGRKVPLFEAMSFIVSHATAVQQVTPVNFTDPDAFYVYRNGLGETMDYLNISTFEFVTMELGLANNSLAALTASTLLSAHFILLACLCVAGYSILVLEQKNAAVWRWLYACEKRLVVERCQAIRERNEFLDVMEGQSLTYSRVPKKRKVYYQCFGAVAVLLLQVLFTSCFSIYISIYTEQYVHNVVSSKIPYMNWAGCRRWQSSYNYLWLRELYFAQFSPTNYFAISPSYQHTFDAWEMSKTQQEFYHITEKVLLYGSSEALIHSVELSERHANMLFSNPCGEIMGVAECETSVLKKGLHYSLNAYSLELIVLRDMIREGIATWMDVQTLVDRGRKIGLGFAQIAIVYDQDGSAEVQTAIVWLEMYLVAYLLLALGFSVGVVMWTSSRYRRRLGVVLSLCKMMQGTD